jgi:hypothetical protein
MAGAIHFSALNKKKEKPMMTRRGVRHRNVWTIIARKVQLVLLVILISPVGNAVAEDLMGPLPPPRHDPNEVRINRLPAIRFSPHEMKDPASKKKLGPEDIITLKSGRKVKAGDYYRELNRLEFEFNKLGYSLRDNGGRDRVTGKRSILLQENPVNVALFQQQQDMLNREHLPPSAFKDLPVTPEKTPLLNKNFITEIGALHGVQPRSIEEATTAEELEDFRKSHVRAAEDVRRAESLDGDRALGVEDMAGIEEGQSVNSSSETKTEPEKNISTRSVGPLSEQEKKDFQDWRQARKSAAAQTSESPGVTTRGKLSDPSYPNKLPKMPDNPQEVHRIKTWNWQTGNSTFGAYLRGKGTLDGYSTMVTVHGDGQAGGNLVGSSVTILEADGTVKVPERGDMNATLLVKVVGSTVLNTNVAQTLAWSTQNTLSRSVNRSSPTVTVWIGPIPVSFKVGLQGSAGIKYTVGFRPIRAYASLTPFLDTSAYAQAGVGADFYILEAFAGVRGTLTLVKDSLTTYADVALKVVDYKWAYGFTFSIYNDLSMLSGKIDLVAGYGFWCPDFDDWWCTDEWVYNLFNWAGFRSLGYLVNESSTLYL